MPRVRFALFKNTTKFHQNSLRVISDETRTYFYRPHPSATRISTILSETATPPKKNIRRTNPFPATLSPALTHKKRRNHLGSALHSNSKKAKVRVAQYFCMPGIVPDFESDASDPSLLQRSEAPVMPLTRRSKSSLLVAFSTASS